MAKIIASLLAVLVLAQAAMAQFAFTNPSYFPNQCKKPGQIAMFYTEGPAATTATLLTNLNGVLATSALSFLPVTTYLKDVTSNVPLKTAAQGGALIGLRWTTQVNLANATESQIISQLNNDCTAIQTYTGKVPKYIFLPETQVTEAAYKTIVAQGYQPIGYNLDSQDYMYATANSDAACITAITKIYTDNLKLLPNGTASYIAINRDLYACSATAAPYIVRAVQSYNYTLVDLATCLGDSSPYRTSCTGGAAAATTTTGGSSPATTKAGDSTAAATTAAGTNTQSTNSAAAGTKSGAMTLQSSAMNVLAALVFVAAAFARL